MRSWQLANTVKGLIFSLISAEEISQLVILFSNRIANCQRKKLALPLTRSLLMKLQPVW